MCRFPSTVRRPEPGLHLFSCTSPSLTSQRLPLPSSPCFTDGMCSCCCLLFPFAVFASQHGDFGIAAELRCQGNELCCRTAYTWDLESLSVFFPLLFIPPFSQVFLGVAEASRTPVLLFLSLSPSYHPQKYSHIHNETQLKKTFVSCASITSFYFHLLISLSVSLLYSVPSHSHVGFQTWLCGLPQSPESPGIHHCLHFTLKHNGAVHRTALQIPIT